MPRIRSLKPTVSREEAMQDFSSPGLSTQFRRFWNGQLQSVAEFYIPFRLFRVAVHDHGQDKSYILGLDLVRGTLDPYQFDQLPSSSELISVDTRNCAPILLSDEKASALITKKVRHILAAWGFFRMSKVQITADPIPGDIHVPYWIGLRGRGTNPHLSVLDAYKGQIEGQPVRKLLQTWLLTAA